MPRESKHRKRSDSVLFVIALLVVAAGVGLIAAYEHGYFADETVAVEPAGAGGPADLQATPGRSPEQPETTTSTDVASGESPESDLLYQPTLLIEGDASSELHDLMTASERDSLQRLVEVIDSTLEGRRSEVRLSDADWQTAERYRSLLNPVRLREYWFRTAVRTPGYSRLERLRDQGEGDDFKSAAIAWVQLDGITRGLLLEILQAVEDEDGKTLAAHRKLMREHADILGIDASELPLRAPRP